MQDTDYTGLSRVHSVSPDDRGTWRVAVCTWSGWRALHSMDRSGPGLLTPALTSQVFVSQDSISPRTVMAPLVNWLLHKHKELSSDPPHLCRSWVRGHTGIASALRRGQSSLANNPSQMHVSGPVRSPLSKVK